MRRDPTWGELDPGATFEPQADELKLPLPVLGCLRSGQDRPMPVCSCRSAPPIAASVWQPLEVCWLSKVSHREAPVTDVVAS